MTQFFSSSSLELTICVWACSSWEQLSHKTIFQVSVIFGEAFFAPPHILNLPRETRKKPSIGSCPRDTNIAAAAKGHPKANQPKRRIAALPSHWYCYPCDVKLWPTPLLFAKMSELSLICKHFNLYLAKRLFNDISNFIEGRLGLLTPQFLNFLYESKG